jgi:hypothetical protein
MFLIILTNYIVRSLPFMLIKSGLKEVSTLVLKNSTSNFHYYFRT